MDAFFEQELNDLNNFSYWFPKVQNMFKVPETKIFQVPYDVSYFVCNKYYSSRESIPKEVTDFFLSVEKAAREMPSTEWSGPFVFMKNARFSDKFTFRQACCSLKYAKDILEHYALICNDSMCCDALGFTELVIRQYIGSDNTKVPSIYNGMPLRPEYRVFYDFDQKKVLHIHDYWDYDYVTKGLRDASDKIVFEVTREDREKRWSEFLPKIEEEAKKLDGAYGFEGIWSFDFMVDEDDTIWFIDAALGQDSTYFYAI